MVLCNIQELEINKKEKKYLNNNLIITNIKIKIKIRESVLYISFAYINI